MRCCRPGFASHRSTAVASVRRRRRNAEGFTLVELLIALAIVSLITLMLFSGLSLGSRAWESVDAVSERVSEVRVTRDFLMSTLSQARATTLTLDAETINVFAGDSERLEFVAPLSEQVGVPGLYILRLGLVPIDRDVSLVLTRWLVHPEVLEGTDDIPTWEPLDADSGLALDSAPLDMDAAAGAFGRTLLLDRVAEFGIAYFGTADGETEPDWHEEWLGQSTMPTLLRIHMATTEQSWPDLIVGLPVRLF
ncbi:General secretion pathway protein J [Thiocapsa sp. KS1]|jgi:general secretion pathway protein J|nr:prepilin-type N-terminal cleavage/methylation domain-containing protein [Thiocapsa sp. KS1]CRI64889.1 General secretion pathway protein J [Thiocapsa sp. KS1]